jgi:hypothetical protein
MSETGPKHVSQQLSPQEEIHLIQAPNSKWRISSIDVMWIQGPYSWPDGTPPPVPEGFNLTKVWAEQLGWEDLEFDTPEQAHAYVEEQTRAGNIPWRIEMVVEVRKPKGGSPE